MFLLKKGAIFGKLRTVFFCLASDNTVSICFDALLDLFLFYFKREFIWTLFMLGGLKTVL